MPGLAAPYCCDAHTHRWQVSKKADLCIQLDVGGAQANEACEEGLVQVAVLLEGHVLDNRGQLVVVSYQDHTLQSTVIIFLPLQPYKYTLVQW